MEAQLDTVLKDFLFHCEFEKKLNSKTISAYRIDLYQFKDFIELNCFGSCIEDISKQIIKSYLREISNFKPKTIKRKVASIKAMFNYFDYESDVFNNPFKKIKIQIKEPLILPTVMNIAEIKSIFNRLYNEHSKAIDIESFKYKTQLKNLIIFELLFATGMRVSELCRLKTEDIDLSTGYLKIFGKGSKERIIQICSKDIIIMLRKYKRIFKPKEFFLINRLGNPVSTQSVRSLVRKYVKSLNLKKHITPHTFRHSFATLLLEADVDIKYIQHLLGHSSIVTTQIYTHINNSKLKKILSTKHPRGKIKLDIYKE